MAATIIAFLDNGCAFFVCVRLFSHSWGDGDADTGSELEALRYVFQRH